MLGSPGTTGAAREAGDCPHHPDAVSRCPCRAAPRWPRQAASRRTRRQKPVSKPESRVRILSPLASWISSAGHVGLVVPESRCETIPVRSTGFLVKGLGCRQWNIWLHTPALPSFQVSKVSARQPVLATRVTPVVRHVVVNHLLVLFIC